MSEQRRGSRIEDVRAQFLTSSDAGQAVPTELLESWLRSKSALGAPANVRDVPRVDEDLLDNHLLEMFQAPMARAAEDLAGSGMGLLLADAQGRIVQRWSLDSSAMNQLDRLGTVRGAVLAEDVVGTNGVGTALASGKSVLIEGAEHFADVYQDALCTGAPVWHPITGKLLAAVTMSTRIDERSGLLLPLTNSLASQLQQHVLDVAQPGARAMLAAFLDASGRHNGPVVAFGPDGLTMRSRRAGELTQSDVDLIGHLCAGLRHDTRMTAELSIGTTAVDVSVLDGAAGMVAALSPAPRVSMGHGRPSADALVGQTKSWLSAVHHVSRHIASRTALLIAGEPGSGKTSLALGRPHRLGATQPDVAVVHTAQRQIVGEQAWLAELAATVTNSPAPRIVVRAVEHLDAQSLAALRTLIDSNSARTSVLLTATAETYAAAEVMATRLGMAMVWVPPLRERAGDIAALWNVFVAQRSPGLRLTLGEDARRALEAAGWPGNLAELRTLVSQLVSEGVRGVVQLDHLPDSLRARRAWSMIERTEMEAIRRALQEAGGNRSKAAELLGVSRATIHRKLKTYNISG